MKFIKVFLSVLVSLAVVTNVYASEGGWYPYSADDYNSLNTQGSVDYEFTPRSYENILYHDVITEFENKRFQFTDCRSEPNWFTHKNGVEVMLDNFSNEQITVYLDATPVVIAPYGYKIINIEKENLLSPHMVSIDCKIGSKMVYNTGGIYLQR